MSWIYKIGRILLLGPFYKLLGPAKAESQSAKACGQSANVAGRAASGSFLGSIAKSLFMSAIVIGASFALMLVNPTLGVIAMMVYSSYIVINSSRKEIPLNKFTSLLPGVMAIVSFLVMMGLIRSFDGEMAMLGMVPGAVVGLLMARGHKVYSKNGIVYAKRTFFYIVIWAISMLITQGSTLLGVREITEFSSMLNGFSTAMMVVLSVFLFVKASGGGGISGRTGKKMASAVFLALSVFTVSILFNTTQAISGSKVEPTYSQSGKYIGPAYLSERTPVPPGVYSGGPDPYRWKYLTHKPSSKDGSWWQSSTGSGGIARVRVNNNGSMELLGEVKCRVKESYGDSLKGTRTDSTYDVRFKQTSPVECPWCDGKVIVNRQINRQGNNPADGHTMGLQHYQHTDGWDIHQRPDGVLMLSFSTCCSESSHCSEQWLLYRDGGSTPSPAPSPSPTPQPDPYPHSDFEFSDGEQAAGILLALMLLATGIGMNAAISAAMSGAMTAAQEAANAAMMAGGQTVTGSSDAADDENFGYDSRTHSNGTLMLDGDEAKDWMRDNGYLDKNGKPNEKFEEFMNAAYSDPVKQGLRGITGEFDDEGNPTGDYVIIVDDDAPVSQADDSRDVDDQSQDTGEDSEDQLANNSSSDRDDGDATKTPVSETGSSDDKKTTHPDDAVDDKKQTPDTPAKKGNKVAPEPKDTQAKPPVEQTPPIEYPNAKEVLGNIMGEITKKKKQEGYFVRNPHYDVDDPKYNVVSPFGPVNRALLEKAFNNNLGWITGGWHPIDDAFGWKGGQCGDYAQKGIEWSRNKIREQYGEGVKFDKIIVKNNLLPSWINHAGTRVTLPNGDKYVLDYWESIQNKKDTVYTEDEWIKKNNKGLSYWQGTETKYEVSTVSVSDGKACADAAANTNKRLLDKLIKEHKEEEGKKLFLERIKKRDRSDLPDAKKLVSQWRPKP